MFFWGVEKQKETTFENPNLERFFLKREVQEEILPISAPNKRDQACEVDPANSTRSVRYTSLDIYISEVY